MTWTPPKASETLEKLMERDNIVESDKNELRRFAEILGDLKKKPLKKLSQEKVDYLLGNSDCPAGNKEGGHNG